MTRQEILARLELERLHPRTGADVAARLRALDLDACTDAELRKMLDELRVARRDRS